MEMCCVVGGVMLIWIAQHPFWMFSVTRQLGIRHPVVFCVYVGGLLPMAMSMAMAAKVPARPWPLMKTALYFWGRRPTRPNRLPCSTAPNAEEEASFNVISFTTLYSYTHAQPDWLTVDEPDCSHCDREEAVFPHRHFDKHCCEDEEQQNKNQATCNADCLRYPGGRNTNII